MKVVVAGGGIGGLTTALALHTAGIEVTLFEAVPEIRPLGVGINLLPHAVRELTELGLADRLAATAIETKELIYANRHGQEIWREPRGRDAGYRWPQYSIHRGRLQMILYEAACERLGRARIRTDRRLAEFEQDGQRVSARFVDRSGQSETVEADLLVAADGIHSAVRAAFHPDEGPPKWNGRILWRAVSEADPFLSGRSMVMAGHQSQKFVCYPICRETAARGRSLVNWIAELTVPERRFASREDWNRPGDPADFLPQFESWDFGWLRAPDLIRSAMRRTRCIRSARTARPRRSSTRACSPGIWRRPAMPTPRSPPTRPTGARRRRASSSPTAATARNSRCSWSRSARRAASPTSTTW